MTARVVRGAFPRWCRVCGWRGTYDTQAKAADAKRRHSCELHLRRAERRARAEAKFNSVDRAPQPCLHPRASHEHGTHACYVLDKCRCIPCTKANTASESERARLKAYGRYDKYVDAGPVRAHLTALSEYGISYKRVGMIAGVSNGTISKIIYGVYAYTGNGKSGGCHGTGEFLRPPAKRVFRTTAEKLLAVQAVPANLGKSQSDHERTGLARQHLHALVALGWSQAKLAHRLDIHASNFTRVIVGNDPMRRDTVDRVEKLYAELSMTLPPEGNQRERIAASRARSRAKELGWLPPLALEEGEDDGQVLDLPTAFDEAAVVRRLDGDRTAHLHQADRAEIVRRAHSRGLHDGETARLTGIDVRDVLRIRQRLGLAARFLPGSGKPAEQEAS